MAVEQMLHIEKYQGKVKVRVDFGNNFVKSPWILESQAPGVVCRLIRSKVLALLKQRKFQVNHGMASKPRGFYKAVDMLEYRLENVRVWNCSSIHKVIAALLPDLKVVAPSTGKFRMVWIHLIAGLEFFAQEEDIRAKITELLSDEK